MSRKERARQPTTTLKAQPDAQAAQEYLGRHRDALRFLGPWDKAAGVMGRLRAENERIEQRNNLSGAEKREQISENNARIRAIAKGVKERVQ